jgi:hypothetical protein
MSHHSGPTPYYRQLSLTLYGRDKRETRDFRAHSEMVYNERVRRIKGVEGWEGGELEGENKGGGGGGGDRNRFVTNS